MLVVGEAGVGKSSLLEELESTQPNALWGWGACDGLFTPRPLGPLLDVTARLGGRLAELAFSGAQRADLFAVLLQQLKDAHALTVFVIEDAHWADEATLDLLQFLSRRIRDVPVLLAVTYRDDALGRGHPLRVTLGELATQRTTRRLDLPPLSAEAVALLVDGAGLEPKRLHRLTGGNPFFLTEILRHGDGELPASARDAVLARIGGLSDLARQTLDVAALLGSRIEPDVLQHAAETIPEAVDELLACGVLVGDGGRLRFRHEIARLAVEEAIGVHRRAPVHRRIFDTLRRSGCDDDARLAFHAEGGDRSNVLLHAPLAAHRAAELGSHREAAAQYERCLRFRADADSATVAGLYDGLAHEYSLIDRWEDSAEAACAAALDLWRTLADPVREGDTLIRLARTMWRLCRGAESQRAAEQALAVLEPVGPSPELARAYAILAGKRMEQSLPQQAIELARHAQALGEELGLPDILASSLDTETCAIADLGGEWRGLLDRVLSIAVDNGVEEQAGRAFANAYALHCWSLSYAHGERYYVDGVVYCEDRDLGTFGTCLRGQRAVALARMGRWDDATSLAGRLLASVASPVNRLNALFALGIVRARRGQEGCWECLDELARSADGLDEPAWIALARLARAEARWLEGDDESAAREIELAAESGVSDVITRSEIAGWQRRITRASSAGTQLVEPFASQVAGNNAGATKQWDDLACPYDAALALLDSTDADLLREALARLQCLGADTAVRVARQRMRRLGVRSIPSGARASTRANAAGLTERECEVLQLICAGHTNEEISRRLFISAKTVDHHVSAVLAKLGVGSRRVAAAEAVRLGLVTAAR